MKNKIVKRESSHRRGNARPVPIALPEGVPPFIHINQNDSSGRKQIKQKLKEEDIHICVCKYEDSDPESACGLRCLNVLTNIECVPGYCFCGGNCKNQRFQKREYAKTKLFKTDGRGWGLLADENIKAGHFVIEYCGEIISSEEAKQRFLNYEAQGVKDFYIILLNANYFIDATNKGSLARFINHSCQPNCETRKWNVLGETRVGIFAKEDISAGTELTYDYNFEWYGSSNVRCLCGAPNCSMFLGAKSRGFQEHNHLWVEGDTRYRVDEIPTYDSDEDEPSAKISKSTTTTKFEPKPGGSEEKSVYTNSNLGSDRPFEFTAQVGVPVNTPNAEASKGTILSKKDTKQKAKMKATLPGSKINGDAFTFNIGAQSFLEKRLGEEIPYRRPKFPNRKQVNGKQAAKLFSSKKVQDEILNYEEIKEEATAKLNDVYDEIRPAIEDRDSEGLDTMSTNLAETWIKASCAELAASFNFNHSVISNAVCPKREFNETEPRLQGGNEHTDK